MTEDGQQDRPAEPVLGRNERKMTRDEVEEEIRRAREHGSPKNVTRRGEVTDLVEDNYPKLDDRDLSGVNLSDLELELANLEGADLRGAILSGTKLPSATLDRAAFTGTTHTEGADLTGATLNFARLGGADLSRAMPRPGDRGAPPSHATPPRCFSRTRPTTTSPVGRGTSTRRTTAPAGRAPRDLS